MEKEDSKTATEFLSWVSEILKTPVDPGVGEKIWSSVWTYWDWLWTLQMGDK